MTCVLQFSDKLKSLQTFIAKLKKSRDGGDGKTDRQTDGKREEEADREKARHGGDGKTDGERDV